jgi:hypothetical protein
VRRIGEAAAQQRQLEIWRVADGRLGNHELHDPWVSTAPARFLRRSEPGP